MSTWIGKAAGALRAGLCVAAGNAVLAFAVAAFILPRGIPMGGTTGLSLALSRLLPLEPALIVLVVNTALLVLGGFVLGRRFFLTTVASTLIYPVLLGFFSRLPFIGFLAEDSLTAALLAGVLIGGAIGLVMRVGSSTGGMDIVTLCLHRWTHLPVSVLVYLADFAVLGVQAAFAAPDKLLLGAVVLALESLVLGQVMVLGKAQLQLFIVSEEYERIRAALLRELQAGVTMALIETGALGRPRKGVLCVIHPRRLYDAMQLVQGIDPAAFTTITKIKEVSGQGFTTARMPLPLRGGAPAGPGDR